MLIRATKKVMDKIKKKEFDYIEDNSIPLNEWYVNHFQLNRKGFFIFTESKSLYSIINESIGIKNEGIFKDLLQSIIGNFEKENSLKANSIDTTTITITKTSNRSILGSQNELIRMAECISYHEDIYKDLDKINETPMMYTKSLPIKDIKKEIERRRNF